MHTVDEVHLLEMRFPKVNIVAVEHKVAVIILNYNRWKDTLSCVKSVLLSRERPHCILVVDNASTNDSFTRIREWMLERAVNPKSVCAGAAAPLCNADSPILTTCASNESVPLFVIKSGRNGGYAAGNNLGIVKGLSLGADAVWVLNNDTIVEPEALGALRDRLFAAPRPGLCGGLLRYPNGLTQCRAGGYTNRLTLLSTLDGNGLPLDQARLDSAAEVESRINFIYGACVMASRNFVETVGLMDEQFFLYCEEQDWAWSAGGRFDLSYAPNAVVTHTEGQSTGHSSHRTRIRSFFTKTRSRFLLCRTHAPLAVPVLFFFIGFASVRQAYRHLRKALSSR